MYYSEICTLTLDLQYNKTLPQYLALLITQYYAITNNRSYCMLPSNRENSRRPNNNILYYPHPLWRSAGLGEEADKGENPSAVEVIMKRETAYQWHQALQSPWHLCVTDTEGRGRLGWGETILTQTQLHEIIQILCASHLTAYYLVVSASEIQTAWLITPLDNSFSRLKLQLACS